ncbi:MAG: DUF7948 domain-containing protein [Candidatus Thorarchaeota archaeon]
MLINTISKKVLITMIIFTLLGAFQLLLPELDGMRDSLSGPASSIEIDKVRYDRFIENKGQFSEEVIFLSPTDFGHIALCNGYFLINVQGESGSDPDQNDGVLGQVVKVDFVDSSGHEPEGDDDLGYVSNYFYGNDRSLWKTGVRNFRGASYRDLWPGIDLTFVNKEGELKYEFYMAPGADPDDIVMSVEGANEVHVEDNYLKFDVLQDIQLIDGPLRTHYSDRDKEVIPSSFRENSDETVGIELGSYDPSREITIDPVIFSTYLGGSGSDSAAYTAIDNDSHVYVAGTTLSADFPTTSGAYSTTGAGSQDVVISKINRTGSNLIFSTYVGGFGYELVRDIKIDDNGDIHFTGGTTSSNFPMTSGTYDNTLNGTYDGFYVKLNRTGSSLEYSTYFGGNSYEYGHALDLGEDGYPVIVCYTYSSDFPTTTNAYQTSMGGSVDFGVLKINLSGSNLDFSTYIGGISIEYPYDLIIDSDDSIVICGQTYSTDFPITSDAYQTTKSTGYESVVLRLSSNGEELYNSTFIGGLSTDLARSVNIDNKGNIIITGSSSSSNYPVTTGSYSTTKSGSEDIIISKFDKHLKNLINSTFIGGSSTQTGRRILIDEKGRIIVGGDTSSSDFPVVNGSYYTNNIGGDDFILFRMDENLTSMDYSTYFGGSLSDIMNGMAINSYGNIVLTGVTQSSDFPTTENSISSNYAGGYFDLTVTLMNLTYRPLPPSNINWSNGPGWVNISWEPSPEMEGVNIAGYRLFKGYNSTSYYLKANITDRNWFNDTSITVGTDHFYYITSYSQDDESSPTDRFNARDRILPVLFGPQIPKNLTTGDLFEFTVECKDNIGVNDVRMEYWYGPYERSNISMEHDTSGFYKTELRILNTTLQLHVQFIAEDSYSNIGSSDEFTVNISDNDPPMIVEDNTPSAAYTSEQLMFDISTSDNILVELVILEVWTEGAEHQFFNMKDLNGGRWKFGLSVPDSYGKLMAAYHCRDSSGNWYNSSALEWDIIDDEEPWIEAVNIPETITTGDPVKFEIDARDNLDVESVWISYYYHQSEERSVELLSGDNGNWECEIIADDTLESLRYKIHVMDTSGNQITSEEGPGRRKSTHIDRDFG